MGWLTWGTDLGLIIRKARTRLPRAQPVLHHICGILCLDGRFARQSSRLRFCRQAGGWGYRVRWRVSYRVSYRVKWSRIQVGVAPAAW